LFKINLNVLFQLMIFLSFLIEKIIIPCSYYAPFSHLAPCTHTKSNLYIANSLAAAVIQRALCRLLTFHVQNIMSIFRCLRGTKVSVQVRGYGMNIS